MYKKKKKRERETDIKEQGGVHLSNSSSFRLAVVSISKFLEFSKCIQNTSWKLLKDKEIQNLEKSPGQITVAMTATNADARKCPLQQNQSAVKLTWYF